MTSNEMAKLYAMWIKDLGLKVLGAWAYIWIVAIIADWLW